MTSPGLISRGPAAVKGPGRTSTSGSPAAGALFRPASEAAARLPPAIRSTMPVRLMPSAGDCHTSWPPRMTRMRRATHLRAASLWLINIHATPSAARRATKLLNSPLRCASRDDVGSSRISSLTRGSPAARAISTIWRCAIGNRPTAAPASIPLPGKMASMLARARCA